MFSGGMPALSIDIVLPTITAPGPLTGRGFRIFDTEGAKCVICRLFTLGIALFTDATRLTEMAADQASTWLHDPAPGRPCTIIGEVAQAHDGSLGMAHAHIDAIAAAGGDAVKFQTHIAVAESTAAEPWRTRFSPQDETRLDYWRRMEFTEDQWLGLRRHADEKSLLFLSSPFSLEATELLCRVGVAGWKVASGEINNFPMLDRMTETGLPPFCPNSPAEFGSALVGL